MLIAIVATATIYFGIDRPLKMESLRTLAPRLVEFRTTTANMFQQVRQLLDLITKSVNTLEQACLGDNAQLPSLDEPFYPASEAFRANPVAAEAVIVISAAAMQLDAIVSPPRAVLHHVVGGVRCIHFLIVIYITERD